MVPWKSTAKEVSFEWWHHRISSTDSKVRTSLHVSIIDPGSVVDFSFLTFAFPYKEAQTLIFIPKKETNPKVIAEDL